jgi:hypothetical protein
MPLIETDSTLDALADQSVARVRVLLNDAASSSSISVLSRPVPVFSVPIALQARRSGSFVGLRLPQFSWDLKPCSNSVDFDHWPPT